jgi:ketosteroid isomerase-like protein
MSEQKNVAIVKQALAAFQRGELQTFLNFFSDDAAFRHPMSTAIWPWAGTRHGRAQLAESAAGVVEVIEFEWFEPREFIAQGNKVVVLVFDNDYVHVFTVSEGKIVQFCVYEDTAPIIAAIRNQEAI